MVSPMMRRFSSRLHPSPPGPVMWMSQDLPKMVTPSDAALTRCLTMRSVSGDFPGLQVLPKATALAFLSRVPRLPPTEASPTVPVRGERLMMHMRPEVGEAVPARDASQAYA